MKRSLVQLPIWLWLLLLGFVEITIIYPLLGYSYVEIGSIIPIPFLFSYSIHIQNTVNDQDGNYQPFKYLWYWILGTALITLAIHLSLHEPLEKLIFIIIRYPIGGLAFRLIEGYAVFRYHYLKRQTRD